MPEVTYINADGGETTVDVPEGNSVMEGAIHNMVDGILAECGGACACATCHCYVDPAWIDKVEAANEYEQDLLEMVIDPEANSRLSCQIKVTAELNGLVVRLPKSQV